jgi:hypothetical protein
MIKKQDEFRGLTPTQTAASKAYYLHHSTCPQCIGAGQGRGQRCRDGLVLWNAYLGVV